MGGPCLCNGKAVTPGTDNFEIATFIHEGVTYYSAEQFYQALKMQKQADCAKIVKCVPKPREKAWDHGMRVWQAGQIGSVRKDWEAVKVEAMYFANRVKLEQNPVLLASLLESNGAPDGIITHMGSGKFWDQWNPVILMLLREELSPGGGSASRVAELQSQMQAYRTTKHGHSLIATLMPSESSISPAETASGGDCSVTSLTLSTDEVSTEDAILSLCRQYGTENTGTLERPQLLAALQKVDSNWTEERVNQVLMSLDAQRHGAMHSEDLFSKMSIDTCQNPIKI
jgi:predicted NAD-dependent protein-ADP-ribosyltransferase YbiA (DUF1768 family)